MVTDYNEGDIVTRTGSEIFKVVSLNFDCDFATFKCIYTQNDIYYVGESESNILGRYNKVTKDKYPKLYEIALQLKERGRRN